MTVGWFLRAISMAWERVSTSPGATACPETVDGRRGQRKKAAIRQQVMEQMACVAFWYIQTPFSNISRKKRTGERCTRIDNAVVVI